MRPPGVIERAKHHEQSVQGARHRHQRVDGHRRLLGARRAARRARAAAASYDELPSGAQQAFMRWDGGGTLSSALQGGRGGLRSPRRASALPALRSGVCRSGPSPPRSICISYPRPSQRGSDLFLPRADPRGDGSCNQRAHRPASGQGRRGRPRGRRRCPRACAGRKRPNPRPWPAHAITAREGVEGGRATGVRTSAAGAEGWAHGAVLR